MLTVFKNKSLYCSVPLQKSLYCSVPLVLVSAFILHSKPKTCIDNELHHYRLSYANILVLVSAFISHGKNIHYTGNANFEDTAKSFGRLHVMALNAYHLSVHRSIFIIHVFNPIYLIPNCICQLILITVISFDIK